MELLDAFFHISTENALNSPRASAVLRSLARPLHRTWRVFLTWTSVRRVWFCHWKGCGLRLQGCRELIERNSWFKWLSRSISYGCPSLMAVRLLSSKRTWFRWPKCLSGVQVHPEDRQPEDFVPGWKFSFDFQEFFWRFQELSSYCTYSLKVSQLTIWVAVPRRCHSPLVIKYGNGISSISSQL